MRHAVLLLLSALLAVACDAPKDAGPSGVFTLSSSAVWAGSSVVVASEDFPRYGDEASLRFGGRTLPLTRIDDTHRRVTIPSDLSGTEAVQLVFGTTPYPGQVLRVAGFEASTVAPFEFHWEGTPIDWNGHAAVQFFGDGITRYDLETGAVEVRTAPHFGLRAPGPTYQPGVYIVGNFSGPLERWTLGSAPAKAAGSVPLTASRYAMQLGPETWLHGSSHSYILWTRPDAAAAWQVTETIAEETEGMYMSPRYDRATMAVDRDLNGIAVFSVPSGSIAYRVAGLRSSYGVAFSGDGERLALIGWKDPYIGPAHLVVVDAATGAVAKDTLFDRNGFAAAFDRTGTRLYVGLLQPDGRPTILVMNTSTWQVMGELAVPATAPKCPSECYKTKILVGSNDRLYVYSDFDPPAPIIYRFSALPAQ